MDAAVDIDISCKEAALRAAIVEAQEIGLDIPIHMFEALA
jgi:hypothetical protein